VVKELYQRYNVIVTHAGDMLSPLQDFNDFGKGMIEMWNYISNFVPFIATMGNHECDIPLAARQAALTNSHFIWTNSNIELTPNEPNIHLPVIFKAGTTNYYHSIGIVGLLTNDPQSYGNDMCKGATIQSPFEMAQQVAQQLLTQEKIDHLIALTHLSEQEDLFLALGNLGYQLILGGHDHYIVQHVVSLPNDDDNQKEIQQTIPILKSGENLNYFHRIQLTWEDQEEQQQDTKSSLPSLLSISYEIENILQYPPDPDAQAMVDSLYDLYQQYQQVSIVRHRTYIYKYNSTL
jgi:2',3'-cyclic-nucleotide 2'-phosphodiesterase (5'-nucleotidase family)